MVEITANLHTVLQRKTDAGTLSKISLKLPAQSSISDLLVSLGIHIDIDDILLVVNGKTVGEDYILSEGDQVHLIPAISGG